MNNQRALLVKTDAQKEKISDRVFYLGPWCRDTHKGSGHSCMLPYHLDNNDNVDKLHELSNRLFDFYVIQLSSILNDIHGMNWSDRAWMILIGPWLTVFLDVVIDRFETISQLKNQPFDLNTDATSYPYGSWAPLDTAEFISMASESDQFNEYLFGNMLVESPNTRNMVADLSSDVRVFGARDERPSKLKRAIFTMLGLFRARLPRRVTFVDSYFHPFDQIALEFKLRQIPLLFSLQNIRELRQPVDRAMRQRLNVQPNMGDSLDAHICRLLPELFPKLYLEEFKRSLEAAAFQYPRKTGAIVTAHAYSYNELFRFWAASQIDSGTKLMCIQHGGGYGVGLRWSALEHEFRVADYYFTSGWVSQQSCLTVPMPIPKLATSKKNYAAVLNNTGRGLWVWRMLRRYPFRIAEGSISQDTEYLKEQLIFGHALQESITNLFTLRLRSPDNSQGEKELVRREFPKMLLDEFETPFKLAARNSRLWIITNNGTSLLEALVANIPFIAFWNPAHCLNKLSEEALPLFDDLKRCGVFHESPGAAGQAVNEHFANPSHWWCGAEIQRVRLAFCEKFAITRENWLDIWAKKLNELS